MRKFASVLLMALLGLAFNLPQHLKYCYAEHAGELGYCVLCDTVIMEKIDFHIRPNKEYRELWFEFSNGSKGKIAFCKKDYEKLLKYKKVPAKILDKIMSGIKKGWESEFILNGWSQGQIDKYKKDFFSVKIVRRLDNAEIPAGN